jgi:hypothetical protein
MSAPRSRSYSRSYSRSHSYQIGSTYFMVTTKYDQAGAVLGSRIISFDEPQNVQPVNVKRLKQYTGQNKLCMTPSCNTITPT